MKSRAWALRAAGQLRSSVFKSRLRRSLDLPRSHGATSTSVKRTKSHAKYDRPGQAVRRSCDSVDMSITKRYFTSLRSMRS
jgi:hypothetical protein